MASLNLIIVSVFILFIGTIISSQLVFAKKDGPLLKALNKKEKAVLGRLPDQRVIKPESEDFPELRQADNEDNVPKQDQALKDYYAYYDSYYCWYCYY